MTYADINGSRRLPQAESGAGPGTRIPRRRSGGRMIERIEIRLLVALTFPLFLAVAVLSRFGLRRPRFDTIVAGAPRSVFAEARETAGATIQSAFRG